MHYKRARSRGLIVTTNNWGAGLRFLRSLPDTDECIEYPFGRFSTGYGHVKVNGRGRTAHAVAYEMHVASIPAGMEVCHNCGNRPCVNPRHLRADTHAKNMADKVPQGTHHRGERNGNARLTASDVREIRARASGGRSFASLAADFGVTSTTVSSIVHRRSWSHLDEQAEIVRRVAD